MHLVFPFESQCNKTVFRVSDLVGHRTGCVGSEDSKTLEILDLDTG